MKINQNDRFVQLINIIDFLLTDQRFVLYVYDLALDERNLVNSKQDVFYEAAFISEELINLTSMNKKKIIKITHQRQHNILLAITLFKEYIQLL